VFGPGNYHFTANKQCVSKIRPLHQKRTLKKNPGSIFMALLLDMKMSSEDELSGNGVKEEVTLTGRW
jgi:hypothetical protein